MEHIEKNAAKSYSNKDDDPISGLNLRLRYMIKDFEEFINAEHNNAEPITADIERAVKVAS